MNKITREIEELSIQIIMADPSSLNSLCDLRQTFEDLLKAADAESNEYVAQIASGTIKYLEIKAGEDSDDITEVLEIVSQTIESLRSIIIDEKNSEDVKFPKQVLSSIENTESGEEDDKPQQEQDPLNDPVLITEFISEARDHLDEANTQLLVLEENPEDKEAVDAVYRAFHTIKGVAGFLSLDNLGELAHETENLLDNVRSGNISISSVLLDAAFTSLDTLMQMIQNTEDSLLKGEEISCGEIPGDILDSIKNLYAKNKDGNNQIDEKKDIDNINLDLNPEKPSIRETIKIDTERLDKLVDTIGELVIAESMVTQDSRVTNLVSEYPRISRNISHLSKITRQLQEIGMSLRLVPIRPVFQRMARLVRDLKRKTGKEIELVISGEETEVDKSIVENISDPLTHMIRNAIDHGIESTTEDRLQIGKPAAGKIELRAFQKSGSIFIEVEDDGRGLDKEAILSKAIEKGLVSDGESISDRELYNLIFAPGFSTAKNVTEVSGRGVGMDVVRKNIQTLRGQVNISSVPQKGTNFSIHLPLTLVIIDGTVVKVGTERYIIPTLSVIESHKPLESQIFKAIGKGEMVSIRDQVLPLFRLSHLLGIKNAVEKPIDGLVIIVENERKQIGLLVDDFIGHQQVVIKGLEDNMGLTRWISGGTIMADGKVGLVLDVDSIMRLAMGVEKENDRKYNKQTG
ncbi:chemotaxis protein CheA [Candidatus Poribacteria bacterium]|nr:chemotaxis protein CheA [Candidatus Poribacteria bacterium]